MRWRGGVRWRVGGDGGWGAVDMPRHERRLRWVEVPSDLSRGRCAQGVHLQKEKKMGLGLRLGGGA